MKKIVITLILALILSSCQNIQEKEEMVKEKTKQEIEADVVKEIEKSIVAENEKPFNYIKNKSE
jgi:PBP1b-binding outer membrane lipoprotein LpoB